MNRLPPSEQKHGTDKDHNQYEEEQEPSINHQFGSPVDLHGFGVPTFYASAAIAQLWLSTRRPKGFTTIKYEDLK